jgi:hypothetical protein
VKTGDIEAGGRCDDPWNRLHARFSIAAFFSCGEIMCNERVIA